MKSVFTIEKLKNEIMNHEKPQGWRDGQMVFNYMDYVYRVARDVQFKDGVDCFYRDDKIDDFLACCVKRLNERGCV